MKFFRNYIILVLVLIIIMLVLQKMKIIPTFSEFMSNLENREEKIKYIVSSIKSIESATAVYYIDQDLTDTTISDDQSFKNSDSWFRFYIPLKQNFSENMVDISGKKIYLKLPKPELSDGIIRLTTDKIIIESCQKQTRSIIEQLLKKMGYTEIKIEFSVDN